MDYLALSLQVSSLSNLCPLTCVRMGLDPKLLVKIVNMSSGVRDEEKHVLSCFCLSFLSWQVLSFAQNTDTYTETPVPLCSMAHQIYLTLCICGYANKVFSVF
uniref:Uncharacterized protein n=1 Tax=Electrophorus electricus TaxID=8005 RepID=A0A4W4DTH2_ELEEL